MKYLFLQDAPVSRRRAGQDPLFEPISMRGMIVSPKEIIKRHLKEHKDRAKNTSISEKDLLDAVGTLEGAAKSDKETQDLLYALSDLCPHESVKRKAIETLRK